MRAEAVDNEVEAVEKLALDLRHKAAARALRRGDMTGVQALLAILAPSRQLQIISEEKAVEIIVHTGCVRCGGSIDEEFYCSFCGAVTIK